MDVSASLIFNQCLEFFEPVKEFKALIENQTGRHTRILRSDNRGEYESNEFDDFCREAGIKKELAVPYNPQQNRVAESNVTNIVLANKLSRVQKEIIGFICENVGNISTT